MAHPAPFSVIVTIGASFAKNYVDKMTFLPKNFRKFSPTSQIMIQGITQPYVIISGLESLRLSYGLDKLNVKTFHQPS
jgi:hypothetical protein